MLDNLTSFEVKNMLSALEDLLEIKILLRKIAPDYFFDEYSKEKYLSILASLNEKIQPIFQKYLTQINSYESILQSELEFLLHIKEEDNTILVSASSTKKVLKKLEFNPINIIVSGGPLIFEDYKKINPHLSDQSLSGIKRKCQNILNILKSQKVQEKPLIFIYEIQNPTDKIILNELNNLIDLVGKKVKTYKISSWKGLEKHLDV